MALRDSCVYIQLCSYKKIYQVFLLHDILLPKTIFDHLFQKTKQPTFSAFFLIRQKALMNYRLPGSFQNLYLAELYGKVHG